MADVIITGASRGIGRALALELAGRGEHLVLVARDTARLGAVAKEVNARGGRTTVVTGDVSTTSGALRLSEQIRRHVDKAVLVQNAGIWPTRREQTVDGLEMAFAVNFIGPVALQNALLDAGVVTRVMVVSAGLIIKARYDADRTPTGEDFSSFRTYCTTKLGLAIATRDAAAAHSNVDFLVLHPGVVRTDLGARRGLLGVVLSLVKRTWESPEVCAARLGRILDTPRWSTPGEAAWWVEETPSPWPEVAENEATRTNVRAAVDRYAGRATDD